MAFFFLLQREGGGDGVSGGGGRRRRRWGERKEPSVSACGRARGCARWSLLSQRVALRPSPVAVCEGGREPGSLSSLPLSPRSLFPLPLLSVCVCACVWLLGEGSARERRGRWCAGGGGGGAGVGAEVSRTQRRGHLLTIGCKLHGQPEAHAGRRSPSQILGAAEEPRFPARPPFALPPRAGLRLSRPARRAVDYFLLLSEIIVWRGWKEGVSAGLSLRVGVCVCVCGCVCK